MRQRRPSVTIALIVVNIAVFILAEIFFGPTGDAAVLRRAGGQVPSLVMGGEYWRLVSSMFIHSGIRHLLNNMLILYVLGEFLERLLGHVKFAVLYLLGGLAGNLAELAFQLRRGEDIVSVGASGAVFAIMGGVLLVLLRHRGHVRGLSIRQILIMLAFSVYFGFASEGIANEAHIGGLIAGFLLALLLYVKEMPVIRRRDREEETRRE